MVERSGGASFAEEAVEKEGGSRGGVDADGLYGDGAGDDGVKDLVDDSMPPRPSSRVIWNRPICSISGLFILAVEMRRRKKMERKSRYTVRMEEGLKPEIETKLAQRGSAARWSSQSWLQPAFQPAGRDCTSSAEPARKPAQAGLPAPQFAAARKEVRI
jgi:hypothetical protein